MRITRVRATQPIGPFEWTLVRVDTDEGVFGLGEMPIFSRVHRDDITQIESAILGKSPLLVEAVIDPMLDPFTHVRNVSLVHAVDMALLDIAGKALNVPVHVLLGGKRRDRVRMYADSHGGVDWSPDGIQERTRYVTETGMLPDVYTPEAYAGHARQVVEDGFTAVKFDIDFPTPNKLDVYDRSVAPAELAAIIEVVAAISDAIGPDIDLAIDLHARYNVSDALKIAYETEPFNLMWLEDPVPPGNHDMMKKVHEKARVPLCTGERLVGREQFRDLTVRQAVDVLQPDTPHSCGMRDLKKIADLADLYGISIGPHNMTSPVGTLAAVHACAAVPNFLALEFHCRGIEWWNDVVESDAPMIQNGYITVPDGPGLGVKLNEEFLSRQVGGPLWEA